MKNKKMVILLVCFAAIMGSVALLLYTVFVQKTTTTTRQEDDKKLSVFECVTDKDPENAFYQDERALSVSHKIKIVFQEGKPGKISYEYRGKFEDDETAKNAQAIMHGNFFTWMDKYVDDITGNFGSSNQEVRADIYVDAGKMSTLSAPMFFLSEQEGIDFYTYSDKTLEAIYKAQGFLCEMKE